MTRRLLICMGIFVLGATFAQAAAAEQSAGTKSVKTDDKDKDKDKDKGAVSVPDGDLSSALLLGLGVGSVLWAASRTGVRQRT